MHHDPLARSRGASETIRLDRPLLDLSGLTGSQAAPLAGRAHVWLSSSNLPGAIFLLRGRNVALVCEDSDDREAALLRAAVSGIGASMASIKPSSWGRPLPADMESTARMLGRLYDLVICQDADPCLVAKIQAFAGVPVFNRIARWSAATTPHAPGAPAGEPGDAERLLLLQDALLEALGRGIR